MSSQRRAEFLLLLTTVVWGSTFVISKALLETNSPLFYSALRFVAASAILFALFPRRLSHIPASTWRKGAILGILLYGGFAVQTVGQTYTTASKSAFFTGMLVVLTPIVHYFTQHYFRVSRRDLKAGNIVGVLCSAAGLFLMTSPSGSAFNRGDAMSLICALFFALYIVYLDLASVEPDKLQLTLVQFIMCAAIGLPVAGLLESVRVNYSAANIASLLYLTIVATILAMWIQNRYQADTTPTRAAVIFSLEPVIAAVFAFYIRREDIGGVGVVGGMMIVSGVLLSELSDEIPFLRAVIRISGPLQRRHAAASGREG